MPLPGTNGSARYAEAGFDLHKMEGPPSNEATVPGFDHGVCAILTTRPWPRPSEHLAEFRAPCVSDGAAETPISGNFRASGRQSAPPDRKHPVRSRRSARAGGEISRQEGRCDQGLHSSQRLTASATAIREQPASHSGVTSCCRRAFRPADLWALAPARHGRCLACSVPWVRLAWSVRVAWRRLFRFMLRILDASTHQFFSLRTSLNSAPSFFCVMKRPTVRNPVGCSSSPSRSPTRCACAGQNDLSVSRTRRAGC